MSPLDSIHTGENQSLSEGNLKSETEKDVLSVHDIPEDIKTILEDSSIWDEPKGNQQEELQKFQSFIENNPNIKTDIFQHLRQIDVNTLGDYIYENGYIINQDTLLAFQNKFQISIIQESLEVKAEFREAKAEKNLSEKEFTLSEQEKINSFNTLFQNQIGKLSSVSGASETLKKVQEAQKDIGKTPEAIIAIEKFFQGLSRPEKKADFQKVAQTFYDESPASYEQYKSYALSVNPSLATNFREFEPYSETTLHNVPGDLQKAQIIGGLGTEKFKKYGSIVEATQDGSTVRMDIGDVPPTRSLALEGSEYSLDTDVPIGDFYSAISNEGLAYESAAQEDAPKIDALGKLMSPEIQDFLESNDFEQMTLSGALLNIALMVGLKGPQELSELLGKTFSSKEELKTTLQNTSVLFEAKSKLEKNIDTKKKAYQTALKKHVQAYKENLQKSDEKMKETLKFFHDIGFDMIPKSMTDMIFSQINIKKNIDLGNGKSINEDIDIANGQYGFNALGDGIQEKQGFIRLMNKILTGVTDGEGAIIEDPASFISAKRVMQDTHMRDVLNNSPTAIISSTGGLDMNQVYRNLGYTTSGK